ncbi:MAG: hypothetical protein C4295_09010 [Candidatus Fervidibacterota bacterium]
MSGDKRLWVAFLGGARYSRPLDATSRKKFRMLSEIGEMFVIGFSQDLRPRRFTEYARFYLFPQWPMPVLRYLTMFTVGPLLALWLVLRHGVRVLVAQSPYEGFAAALAKKIAGWFGRKTALIVENHGDFETSLFLQRRVRAPSLYRLLMRWTASFALKNADFLRAISVSTRSQLERWAPGKPIVQFPTWTDMEVFLAAGDEAERNGKPDGQEVVYVGVLIPRKGVHFLLEAFARLVGEFPEARLSIIGKPENAEYARSLKAQVRSLGLEGRVSFLDPMPQAELARRVSRARVLVLPSLSEGLGRVVFEAMAAGTPVIGSCVDGIPEMVRDGATGFLVPPGDVDALAERLRWALSHPEEMQEMSRRARAFAREFFSPEAYVQNYSELFQMALRQIGAV